MFNELGDRSSDLLAFAGLAVFAARQVADAQPSLMAVAA